MIRSSKFADVSTSLVEDNDLLLLATEPEVMGEILVIASYPEGFFLCVPEEQDDLDLLIIYAKYRKYSEKFIQLMEALNVAKFAYLRLDADGFTTKLPETSTTSHEENGG